MRMLRLSVGALVVSVFLIGGCGKTTTKPPATKTGPASTASDYKQPDVDVPEIALAVSLWKDAREVESSHMEKVEGVTDYFLDLGFPVSDEEKRIEEFHAKLQQLGWKLDLRRFRVYLKHRYHVTKAYLFIGYLPENANLYRALQEYGYLLIFKNVLQKKDGTVKGNVDAELVLHAMIQYKNYDQAVIVTSDGDFACLVEYLFGKEKLKTVLSSRFETCSILLKRAARGRIDFLRGLQEKLAYKKRKGTT